jgi:hypothetical protein
MNDFQVAHGIDITLNMNDFVIIKGSYMKKADILRLPAKQSADTSMYSKQ